MNSVISFIVTVGGFLILTSFVWLPLVLVWRWQNNPRRVRARQIKRMQTYLRAGEAEALLIQEAQRRNERRHL